MRKCELQGCRSGLAGMVRVNEIDDEHSWVIYICQDCAGKLGLAKGDDLPPPDEIERILEDETEV